MKDTGIAELLGLAADIRDDYETGGIMVSHQVHLEESLYLIKEIFSRHLARRVEAHISSGGRVSLKEVRQLYIACYLPRDAYEL